MKNILIIGATSAIAQETSKLFAAQSCGLYLVARSSAKLESVKADLSVRGARQVDGEACDLNDFGHHKDLIDRAESVLGGLDGVLIAHGTLSDQVACQGDYQRTELEFRTNFLSVVSILTEIANRFETNKKGTIVVISSVAGDRGRQSNYVYGAAKGGLSIFLQGLRNRLAASGVQVLTIKPGFVDTPMTAAIKKGPLFAKPEQIAQGIDRAIKSQRNVVYLPWFWLPIMLIIRHIPEVLFKRLKL